MAKNFSLFIKAYQQTNNIFLVNIETSITLFVKHLAESEKINVIVKLHKEKPKEPLLEVNSNNFVYQITEEVQSITSYAVWPIILNENNITAGLCSVSRLIIKLSPRKEIRDLLGFREACLLACSESSIWTKFCEVDIIQTAKKLLNNDFHEADVFYIPENLMRFEYHLSQPVRMHNVYKAARLKNKDKGIKSSVPIGELNLEHTFGEGTLITLADVVLFPCFKLIIYSCSLDLLKEKLPLTVQWFKRIDEKGFNFQFNYPEFEKVKTVVEAEFVKQSLYTTDPKRYRPEKRMFTKQNDIDMSLNLVKLLENEIVNNIVPFGSDMAFDWCSIPLEINPNSGALPEKRADKKCEQLKSLAKAVVKLAEGKSYEIVDFCSGSGHLGILLAFLLPKSKVILVENKEISLLRGRERIQKLGLENIVIVQSNLDYFVGNFDIGVSLHACGVATDLVIQNCIDKRAHFVSCPCCYGGVKDCYHLKYPRSKQFKKLNLDLKNYLSLAHAADQTHDANNAKTKQGYVCMDVIDTDRRLFAVGSGYEVHLGKLQPVTCTNKNNLLVGICKNKK